MIPAVNTKEKTTVLTIIFNKDENTNDPFKHYFSHLLHHDG